MILAFVLTLRTSASEHHSYNTKHTQRAPGSMTTLSTNPTTQNITSIFKCPFIIPCKAQKFSNAMIIKNSDIFANKTDKRKIKNKLLNENKFLLIENFPINRHLHQEEIPRKR